MGPTARPPAFEPRGYVRRGGHGTVGDTQPLELLSRSREGPSSPQHTGCDYGPQQPEASVGVYARVKKKGLVGPVSLQALVTRASNSGPVSPFRHTSVPRTSSPSEEGTRCRGRPWTDSSTVHEPTFVAHMHFSGCSFKPAGAVARQISRIIPCNSSGEGASTYTSSIQARIGKWTELPSSRSSCKPRPRRFHLRIH